MVHRCRSYGSRRSLSRHTPPVDGRSIHRGLTAPGAMAPRSAGPGIHATSATTATSWSGSPMLQARHGVRISDRTLREQLARRGLARSELLRDGRVFGRYEAAVPDERWIGDVLVRPWVPLPKAPGSVRARLFLHVDDTAQKDHLPGAARSCLTPGRQDPTVTARTCTACPQVRPFDGSSAPPSAPAEERTRAVHRPSGSARGTRLVAYAPAESGPRLRRLAPSTVAQHAKDGPPDTRRSVRGFVASRPPSTLSGRSSIRRTTTPGMGVDVR